MARPINRKCQDCAFLSADDAKLIHGPEPEGDGCWDEKVCPTRRYRYRNRQQIMIEKRQKRRAVKGDPVGAEQDSGVTVIPAGIELPAVAYLFLYKKPPKDAPNHAVGIEVWRGAEKVAVVEPIHTLGMTNLQIRDYLQGKLKILQVKYGIRQFKEQVVLDPVLCPVRPCPLRSGLQP